METVYQLVGISKQAVHQKERRSRKTNYEQDILLSKVIALRKSHPGCGVEKMYNTLKPDCIGRDKFIDTFMRLGFRLNRAKNYKRTTYAGKLHFPNLIEGMLVMAKNKVWQTDITYFQVGERYYYITFIVDIYTKVIKGYKVSEHLFAEANIDALQMALRREKNVEGLIHHSDRGSQFTASHYRKIVKDNGIKMSMGLAAWENAYAERINGIIKNEYLNRKTIGSFKTLTMEVNKAVKHYNTERIHNHLPDRKTPIQFENELIHLDTQNRPKVIVYAKGKSKISTASSSADFYPETEPQDHVCPIVNS